MSSIRQFRPGRSPFDDIMHLEDDGTEWWSAREMMGLLGYARWESMEAVIRRAKSACRNANQDPSEHFRDAASTVQIGSDAQRTIKDYHVSRHGIRFLVTLCGQKSDQKGRKHEQGYIYFLHCELNNTVKIGFTSEGTQRRIETIKSMSPVPLVVLGKIRGTRVLERELHVRFADLRDHGEWFRYTADIQLYVNSVLLAACPS